MGTSVTDFRPDDPLTSVELATVLASLGMEVTDPETDRPVTVRELDAKLVTALGSVPRRARSGSERTRRGSCRGLAGHRDRGAPARAPDQPPEDAGGARASALPARDPRGSGVLDRADPGSLRIRARCRARPLETFSFPSSRPGNRTYCGARFVSLALLMSGPGPRSGRNSSSDAFSRAASTAAASCGACTSSSRSWGARARGDPRKGGRPTT